MARNDCIVALLYFASKIHEYFMHSCIRAFSTTTENRIFLVVFCGQAKMKIVEKF